MRHITLVLVSASAIAMATIGANAAVTSAVYASLPTTNAQACARACDEDGLCIAWTHQPPGTCELMAVAPSAAPETGAFGLSSRAPAFAALRPRAQSIPIATETTPPSVETESSSEIAETDDIDPDFALLGGPDGGDIRPRLASGLR